MSADHQSKMSVIPEDGGKVLLQNGGKYTSQHDVNTAEDLTLQHISVLLVYDFSVCTILLLDRISGCRDAEISRPMMLCM
jgi:hypothetical protein